MTISPSTTEIYPGCDYSLSQLLYAAKRKLREISFGGRVGSTLNRLETDGLEQDAFEVLSLVRLLKNSLAPINRIPPEVLLLIPDYCDEDGTDQHLITLTHVCRGWREIFTSRSSLWASLDFTNVEKTRTYIQRSKSAPLGIYLADIEDGTYVDAFSLVVPHIRRLKSLVINTQALPDVLRHFRCHLPLLEELYIDITHPHHPVLDESLFDGDLSSLRELCLAGVTTNLPWQNLANLTFVELRSCSPAPNVTRLLDFFESAPLLDTITLKDTFPDSSNAPPQRRISIPRLNLLIINANPAHSILLNHLLIPHGASLILAFSFGGVNSPLLDYLPNPPANLEILSHITTVKLHFDSVQKFVRLVGPSGDLCMLSHWMRRGSNPYSMDDTILNSLRPSIFSTTKRLAMSKYEHSTPADADRCPIFRTLSAMGNLRSLTLIECNNLPFILALDPEENPNKSVLCPSLGGIVLYIESRYQFHLKRLIAMVKNRASRGLRFSSIAVVGLGEFLPGEEVFELREHIARVECKTDDQPPDWVELPGESGDERQ